MKVLITGATGLVGTALVHSLRDDRHEVCRLLRKKDEDEQEIKQECDLEWDPSSEELGAQTQNAAAVINLAGASIADGRWTEDRKEVLRRSRIETTRALVAAIEKMSPRPKVLISASAIGYYGDHGDEILTEQSSPRPNFLARLAEEWESEAMRAKALGVRVVLARFGIILAKQGGALPHMMLPFRIGAGGKLGSGKQWMSWVTLDDAVRVVRSMIEDEALQGAVNVTAPQPVTNAEFTRLLAHAIHRPAFLAMPAGILRVLLGDMADEMLLASQRVVPDVLREHGYQFAHSDLGSALAAILQE
jgi:uncharacterized protein